ncbi:MAG: 1,4-dihydroxy-2-naphthoate octaprenyltransferase [Chloroflexi bacterium]|nr:1,4-dihydroxy-2-naphthoate octaprenyltransferase [Chloroflexota bacterium]
MNTITSSGQPGETAAGKRTVWQHVQVWYRASRPFTLSASLTPVLVGSSLAFRDGTFSWWLFALVLLGSLLVQAAANLVDEYSDHARPEGNQKMLASYKVIALGLLSSKAVKRGAIAYFATPTAIGLYLTAVSGWPILALCLGSAAAAYFYSGGPRPLGTIGLGQPLVFIFMGPVMVLGAYYVQTRAFTLEALWLSFTVACTVTAILAANDIRDLEEDRAAKKATIVTWLGRGFARWEWTLLVAAAFLIVLGLALLRIIGPTILISLLALPQAVAAVRLVWHGRERAELALALRATARLHGFLGILLAVGVSLG